LSAVPGVSSQITYDAAGRPTTVTNANGTSSQRVYSADRGFLQSIVTTGPTGVIQDLSYGRDDSGLVLSVSSSPFAGESWTYAYDDLDRLVTANNVSNPAETQTFQYDSIGRITYNSAVGTYAYPTPGSPHPHAPSSIAGVGYTYDTNGNLQAGAGRTFTWDAENRLATVDTGGSTTTFTYGASGERLKMASGSSTSLYPFGDDFEIMDGVVVKYLALPGLGVVAKRVASDTFWIHADPLGSINAITNDAGGTVLRRAYRPYGEQQSQVGAHQDTRGYIGQRTDASTGLTYLHARYYDPQVGVFLKPDPIGAVGGLALYSYSGGNPVNFRDVSGLCHPQLCLTFTAPGSGGFHDSAWVYANGGGGGGGTCDLCWVPELVRLLGGWLGFGGGGRSLTPEQQLAGYEATQAFEAQHPGTTTFSHGGPSGHTNAAGAAAAAAAQQTAASTQAAHSPPSAVQSPTSPPSAPRGPSGPSGPSGPVPVPLPTPVPGAGGEGAPADRVGGTSGAEWTAHYAEATVREVFVNQWRRDGGCGRLWLESTAGVVRMAVGLGAGAGVLGGSTARNAASEHVVSRGLRYPLRSSIVRRFNLIARYSPHVGALAGLNVSVFMGIAEQRQAGAFHGGLCR
jgi:RHS repeat-associated protein